MYYYWVIDPSDNAFMGITQREDIGGILRLRALDGAALLHPRWNMTCSLVVAAT